MKNLYKIANPIHRQTVENQGCSMNLNGLSPVKGYMVALKGMENTVNITEFSPAHVDSYIRKNLSVLFNESCYIGTWIKEDLVYMDISINLQEKGIALAYGKRNGQICIWDVLNKVEIYQLQEETA